MNSTKPQMKFYLPDFYYHYNENITLVQLIKEHPEYFHENISIGAVYGTFPGAIWNGGRWLSGITNYDNIQATIKGFNDLDIPIRYTFTNCLLEDTHVYDAYCNLCMKLADNGINEVLVNSPILEAYLREKYPSFKYILSTTRCIRDVEELNVACDKYSLVVIDYRDNRNTELLGALSQKDKIEILINAYCASTCTKRLQHYESLSRNQLTFASCSSFFCPSVERSFFESLKEDTVLKNDELNSYAAQGFFNFKIEGRTMPTIDVIESYVYYLVKPEYKDLVRYKLIRSCWK